MTTPLSKDSTIKRSPEIGHSDLVVTLAEGWNLRSSEASWSENRLEEAWPTNHFTIWGGGLEAQALLGNVTKSGGRG